jgi:hypothetical protein
MKAILAGACLTALFALPATAADVCIKGQIAVVRVSTLKSPASRPAFDKAVTDQIAWYRSHGVTTNKIVTAEVIDMSMGAPMVSTKDVMTIHYDPPAAMNKQPAVDDGYKAFVKEFRDSSDITTEKLVCLPK